MIMILVPDDFRTASGATGCAPTHEPNAGLAGPRAVRRRIQRFRESLQEASAGPEPVGLSLTGVDKDQIQNRDILVGDPDGAAALH